MACIFYQKQQAFLKKIHNRYFETVAGLVYTIEYQKCGLSHMHLLIFLEEEYKIHTVKQVDAFISAQIPDPVLYPQLYEAVSKFMLHGPHTPECCMENGSMQEVLSQVLL